MLLLKLLSDSDSPLSVYDLEKQLDMSRPYLTNHLNELVRQGLVEKRRNLEALGKTRDDKQPRPRYVFKAALDDEIMKDSITMSKF
ncbi:MAG: MarR family transcriptional regulator [Candidatus Hodarchaeota archaeon]